ncbi:glycerophosphodiester phosphodiesterase family protein [Henriciella sp.]|uniref:glycerophosphodiester phosphodiesterase family protein n=1 Tax=Henriciella sp. TaxID=1968823 RepID=UPI00261BB216|nr:glycerophosphodiester phosphodiesterase family protein [Henriciella sp.]
MAGRFQLVKHAYAHRGLWTPGGLSENSLEAILAAADAGLGCEIDVRPAACGTPVVFHDTQLDRTTDETGPVNARTAEALTDIPLKGRGTLTTLEQVLDEWPGNAPLLIELKIDSETDTPVFTKKVAELAEAHNGPAALMSFSDLAVREIPGSLMRGALVMPSALSGNLNLEALVTAAKELNPDYLACHVTDAENICSMASDHELPVAAWTVTSADMSAFLKTLPVAQIFEGFDPHFAQTAT